MKQLILAEKPSVARELARVLGCKQQNKSYIEGPKHIVTWALGHLVELKMPEDYDKQYQQWRLEDLPIIPKHMGLKIIRQVSHQFRAIEQLAKRKDLTELVIATDAGREGELVARWIMEKVKWQKPVKRLWISSQTNKAIRDGFNQLKPAKQYDNLYQSAVCRSEADWLIGLNVTRALTTKYNDPLSAGRVQTPTLAMILEREQEINSFQPKNFWTIDGTFGLLKASWERNGEKRIFDEKTAQDIVNKVKGQTATVDSLQKKEKTEAHPMPYDLTELQRDANRRFGFSAKKTSSVLQKLYEQYKLVTYPRTDSRYLTKDMENTMYDRLQGMSAGYREEVQPLLKQKGNVVAKKVFNDAKVTDHHAIIPTDEPLHLSDLDNDERKLYDLIARRFLALFYPAFTSETLTATLKVGGETFTARETLVLNPGFKVLSGKEEETPRALSSLKEGQTLSVKDVSSEKKLTEPPARFTEADLLSRMEKYSLGTPATRADIIERLLGSEVLDRKNNKLHPTPKGKQLIDLVNDELKSPELTAKWEQELEAIARGNGNPKEFLENIRKQTKQLVMEIKTSSQEYRAHNLTGSKCPECGKLLKEIKGRDGKVLVCSDRECSYRRRKDPKLSNRRCPQCKKKMELHNGKAGTYFQCKPCNVVEKADATKKKVNKREERQLMKKYSANNNNSDEGFGNSLADALKAAMKDKK
ncbi:DNA topoisomerase 3 [Fictibacillus nanhaiensis]|uniref:DNA topoisomerase III n=1 Tax=Fictibacillus nanhaiensis TaxID=742169 RepID=UPI001C943B51|nr:DNA topoisomerase III [Fictibacillus nanhaiensis]MBY6037680.1 DNA topoisomerase 3 [Fictibacillus nanhaiensis]